LSRLVTFLGISFLLATLGVACEKSMESKNDSAVLPTGDLPEAQTKDSEQANAELVPDQLPVDEPNETHPVSTAAALFPTRARVGESLTLVVQIKTAPRWHIYAPGALSGTGMPTNLKLQLPSGVEAFGDWTCPPPHPGTSGQGPIYQGSVRFARRLAISHQMISGPITVTCELGYQACDPFSCRPPETVALKATTEIVPAP
jgi:DsbC/DsbD-like thiol-disulfide interchange protein